VAKKTFRFISSIISIRVRVREVYFDQVTYCGIDMVYIPVYQVYQYTGRGIPGIPGYIRVYNYTIVVYYSLTLISLNLTVLCATQFYKYCSRFLGPTRKVPTE
jgi:hypothetical protein